MKTNVKQTPVIVIFTLWLALSFELHANENHPIKRFDIRPAVCVIERDADCHSRFVFSWDLAYSTRVCLQSNLGKKLLICDDRLSVEVELVVDISDDNQYDLIPQQYSHLIINRKIEVQRLNKDIRILNRRIWSVF